MSKQIVVVRKNGADRRMDNLEAEIKRIRDERNQYLDERNKALCDATLAQEMCMKQTALIHRAKCTDCPVSDCKNNWYYTRGYGR